VFPRERENGLICDLHHKKEHVLLSCVIYAAFVYTVQFQIIRVRTLVFNATFNNISELLTHHMYIFICYIQEAVVIVIVG
jgi:hypothetical protein